MTLRQIWKNKLLSLRAYIVCGINNLSNLELILDFYTKNHSFKGLNNCRENTNKELIGFCLKQLSKNTENERTKNQNAMTLRQILENNLLSVRAYNICGGNNLYNSNLILDFYTKNYSFKKLRNCGDGTNKELIDFCRKKLSEFPQNTNTNKGKYQSSFSDISESLSRKQREVINNFIFINFSGLSVRSQNAVRLHLQGNLKIKNFSRRFFNTNLDVGRMDNVGKKSVPEIEMFIDIIRDYFIEISTEEDENQLTVLRNKFLIQKTFSLNNVPSEILESESIFRLASFLLDKNAFFDEKESSILVKSLWVYDNAEKYTLDEIAEQLNLSRERVRQLRKKCVEELASKFAFLENFNDDLYSNYGIEENSTFIFIDDELKTRINKLNETNFSAVFQSYILSTIRPDYELIGNIEDVLQSNNFSSRNRHNWQSFYLIKSQISNVFDFEKFIDDVSFRLNEKISETYHFNFKSYLSKFLVDDSLEMLEEIMPVAEKIVFEELNLIIDLDDNISFKRNTFKLTFEYALEALEHLAKPSKVKEIVSKVHQLHPNYETTESRMRASLKRKYGFVPVGRKSVFGLKKWEKKFDNFKGGTIRTISEEFLSQHDVPKHIDEITHYVKKYRPKTNGKSIYYNLKMDESRTFRFYENMQIGLYAKKYDDVFRLVTEKNKSKTKTWQESLETLTSFTNQNERLPYSNNCPEEEEKLYRWFNIQKRKVKRNQLNESQTNSIQVIIDKFEDSSNNRRSNNEKLYEELKEFVQQNSRLPKSTKNGEKNLYAFHYKQRKKFEASELNENDRQQLIEVAQLLQNQSV